MKSLLVHFFAAAIPLSAIYPQTPTGSVEGTVVSRGTMEPIPGATISLLNTQQGAAADPGGRFKVSGITVGTYQVRASAVGFRPTILADIIVATGRPVDLMIRLEPTTVDLGEVDIEATYFQKVPDLPVSTQSFSNEEIRRFPGGFEDVVRAVSIIPGVAQAAPGRNDLVVRGGAPSENLYVVDDIEIPNINHFATQGSGGGPLSYINLDFVRETTFSTGGFGVRYGDRLSSVMTIDLKEGRRDALGGKGTISATQFGMNLHGPIGDDVSFLLSARRSYLDFIFRSAGFSFVPEYWDFLAKATYRMDAANSLTFLAIGAIDDVNFLDDDADARFDNSRILASAQKQYASGLSWQHLFGNGFSRITVGRVYLDYSALQRDSLLNPIFTNESIEGETSLRADVVLQPGSATEISFGAQAKRIRFETDLLLPGYVTTFGDTLNVEVTDFDTTGFKGSAYGQLSQEFFRDFRFTLGGRFDHFSLIDQSNYFSPRASLSYAPTHATTVALSAGIYRQFPSYIWLAGNPENRNLLASKVEQYILGVEQLMGADLKFRVEGFYKKYSHYPASTTQTYLVMSNTGSGFGGSDDNFASFGLDDLVSEGTGNSIGIEFMIQKKLSEVPLYGVFSVTLSQTRFTALDGVERDGAFDQPVILNLSAGYRFDERWEASAKFRFASGQPYTPFNDDGTQNVSEYNSLRVQNAHSLDVRVDRRWNFAAWNLIVYLDIQNIYNNKFSGGIRWNSREQKAEFDESAIGILPTIGVSAEF